MAEGDTAPDLRDYLSVLWRRKFSILLVVAVVVGTAMAYSSAQTPMYRSSAELVVRAANLSPTEQVAPIVDMETERRVASSVQVAALALPRLNTAHVRPAAISVQTDGKAQALNFTASSRSPAAAQRTAQAYAEAYLDFRREQVLDDLRAASDPLKQRVAELNAQIDDVQRRLSATANPSEQTALQIRFNSLFTQRTFLEQKENELILPEKLQVGRVIRPAALPGSPSSPDHARTATFALFLALSIGVAQAFVRDRLDERPRGREDLAAAAGVPVLAVIPRVRGRRTHTEWIETLDRPLSPAGEGYRTLRTNLLHAVAADGARSVLITSADVGEGKTTIAMNLSVALSQAGKRVILVGADLRRPNLDALVSDEAEGRGLVGVLQGELDLAAAIVPTRVDRLHCVPAGVATDSFGELLGSEAMRSAVDELSQLGDMVVLDGPPLLGLADALSLAPLVNAVILVTDSRRTTKYAVREARYQLDAVGACVVGAVLNNYSGPGAASYGDVYGGSRPQNENPAGGPALWPPERAVATLSRQRK